MRLRGRIGALAGFTAGTTAALIGGAVFAVYASGQSGRIDGALVRAAAQTAPLADAVKQKASDSGVAPVFSAPLQLGDVRLQLFPDGAGPGTTSDVGPITQGDLAVAEDRSDPTFSQVDIAGRPYRAYTAHMVGTGQGLVRAIYPMDLAAAERWRLALLLAGLALGSGLLAGVLGRLLAARALLPLVRVTATADRVRRTGDLDERLPASGSDETAALARSFNAMLAALDESVGAQRQLVADASHELRTPLTSVLTNLELLDEEPGIADPRAPQLIRQAREQAAELRELVTDLVQLARYGQAPPVILATRLDVLAARVVRRARTRGTGTVSITVCAQPCPVLGDEDALSRAIGNLVDNAVLWSPDGATVTVSVTAQHGDGTVEVRDTGPGIPQDDLPHVFQRFYRSPAARAHPGSGLGLAIVAQVAAMHGGSVTATSGPGGTAMRFRLPLIVQTAPVPEEQTVGVGDSTGGDEDRGGDPACWLNRVCENCGRFVDDPHAQTCPDCGAPRERHPAAISLDDLGSDVPRQVDRDAR
jgi:two-component system sensor histidine kinase MprB